MPIYELSYQRLPGIRKPQRFRFPPIAFASVRQFFKGRANLVLFIAAAGVPLLIGATLRTILFWASDEMRENLPAFISEILHLGPAIGFVFITALLRVFTVLLVLLSASGSIASDLRSNALEIYFSRPITRLDYVLGKMSATLGLVAVAIALPLILLFAIDVSLTEEEGFLGKQLPLLFKFLVAVFMPALPLSLVALALSSVARSARKVNVLFFATILGTKAIAGILFVITRDHAFQLIDLGTVVDRLTFEMLDVATSVSELSQRVPGLSKLRAPIAPVPISHCLMAYLAWLVLPILVLRSKVRGFEVVKAT